MSLIFTLPSPTFITNDLSLHPILTPYLPPNFCKFPKPHPQKNSNFKCKSTPTIPNPTSEPKIAFNYDFDEALSSESPWEGAIVYKRDASVSHLEYCTTLERLGLGRFSTEVSKSRASVMGLRVTKGVKDYPLGTPVLVSVDVSRRRHKLRLDGLVRTVLSLGCNRCGEAAAECVFSNFTLLLTEEAIEEGDVIIMGTLFGEGIKNTSAPTGEDDDDDNLIDMDDKLYFPADRKEIDVSKNIRDLIHVEITINAVCDPGCKGLCLQCGVNLNVGKCRCVKQEDDDAYSGPLRNLRKEMQKK
ncbi:hypothetical protein ACHQM5_015739 [Ranunculus cassubicifolius]